jgi:hypothetical protein
MSKGVQFLMKKIKSIIIGVGKLKPGKLDVTDEQSYRIQ